MHRVSHRLTRRVGIHFSYQVPIWFIVEYPKSGGTWFAKMVADYLEYPFCEFSYFPLGLRCVTFAHWKPHPKLRRCFYVYRDGRDVLVSLYYHRIRLMNNQFQSPAARKTRQRYRNIIDHHANEDQLKQNFTRFVEHEMNSSGRSNSGWSGHINQWKKVESQDVVFVKYEDLHSNPIEALGNALDAHLGDELDADRLSCVVQKFAFQAQTGRHRGNEDAGSFLRKGIVGDWKNYFTKEAAELFDKHHGETLINLGYEPDRSWLSTTEFVQW
ncbi:MAG: sulfotransferase domain-containing protein [Phycisphaerales bacterium]|nr:sulfotransferase domain-containing protein [Phycisphaerales bacterium]